MALTDYTENLILDTLFGVNDVTALGSSALDKNILYVGLFTSETSDTGGGNEVSGSGTAYARIAVANNNGDNKWDDAVLGVKKNAAAITFASAMSSWGTVTHVAIFDALTGGNMIAHGGLTQSKAVASGDTFKFDIGDLQITLN